ncbi:MAG: hypothetical protein A3K65_03375 [Euryarchaeota archaeon RBG_16_68_12]|nr:MAG: hypothetical protein A3K65_03375 [Euryarchaeota archaeon RBG_16_68_12]
MAPGDGLRRFVRVLSAALVWSGAGIAALLTIATFTVERASGRPVDSSAAAGIVATLVLAGTLPIVLRVRRLDEVRRYLLACVAATLLIFVTRPEAIIGGSVALVGGAIGVLRNL